MDFLPLRQVLIKELPERQEQKNPNQGIAIPEGTCHLIKRYFKDFCYYILRTIPKHFFCYDENNRPEKKHKCHMACSFERMSRRWLSLHVKNTTYHEEARNCKTRDCIEP